MRRPRGRASRSVRIVEPVVVKPDVPSKNAFTGLANCGSSERRYGRALKTAASPHVRATTRKPSRAPTRSLPRVAASSPKPKAAVIPPAATKGNTDSP
jgi:hypothetical protein